MTTYEFAAERDLRPCDGCGKTGVVTELNPNNNGLLVVCANCGSKRPWGSLLYLKQNSRTKRKPLPDGETLDSVWAKWGDICFVCGAPKYVLAMLGIGRQVHHVLPYAKHGHQGPRVPVCTLCHPAVTERQRLYWFMTRLVAKRAEEDDESPTAQPEEHDPHAV
jgi:hypothetical protein